MEYGQTSVESICIDCTSMSLTVYVTGLSAYIFIVCIEYIGLHVSVYVSVLLLDECIDIVCLAR